jgi:hypothetical protein
VAVQQRAGALVAPDDFSSIVMPAFAAGIHVLKIWFENKDVDGRDKPGHDEVDGREEKSFRRFAVGCRLRAERPKRA